MLKLLISTFFLAMILSDSFAQNPVAAAIITEAEELMWSDLQQSIEILTTALDSEEDSHTRANYYLALSKCHNQRRNCDSIQYWNNLAAQIYHELSDLQGQAEVLYQQGYEAFCRMEYTRALDYILKGLEIMERLQNNAGMALGYLRMSRIFHFTSKMQQSAEYGRKAGPLFEQKHDFVNAWDSWSFAGHGYRMLNDSVQALECFDKGMEQALLSQIPEVKGMAYNDLAAFYNEASNYDSAIVYFQKALDLVDPSDERQIMVTKNGLGQSYLHSGRYQECIDLLTGALEVIYKTNDLFFMTEVPEYIAQSYAALGQYDSAYKYMELNWRSTDSLFSQGQDKALEEMRSKYESDKKDQLIAQQVRERNYGLALLLAAVILAGMFYLRFINKKRHNDLLNQRNQEKDFLLREIHHRVKNNLQILSSLLNLQADYIQDENALNAIAEGRNRVQSMALIHQQLYSEENMTAVDMKVYLADLCSHLTDSFSDQNTEIEIDYDIKVGLFDVETAIPLGLIVNELITNSIKYAFNDRTRGKIMVKLWEVEGTLLCLRVADDGHGITERGSEKEHRSFGTDLIKILSSKLKGTIDVNTSNGYATDIQFSRYKFN